MAEDTKKPDPNADAPGPRFPHHNADGIDLSLIRSNLRLTPEQRLRRMDRARRAALRFRKHARRK